MTWLWQRYFAGILVVSEQFAETSPANEGVEHLFVIFMRDVHDDCFLDDVAIEFVIRLPLEQLVNVSKQLELQELIAPDGLARFGVGRDELLADWFQNCQLLWGIDEVEHLGGFNHRYHAAEFLVGVGGDSEDILATSAGIEVFQ